MNCMQHCIHRKENKMDIKMELTKLYNTLLTVDTKGESTIVMADCLRFLKQIIVYEEPKQEHVANEEVSTEK